MDGNQRSALPARVNGLRVRVERWRDRRTKRSPMPEDLWSAAVSLALTHGVSPIARALGLDYGRLKQRVAGTSEVGGENGRGSDGFIELNAGEFIAPCEPTETVLELSGADGARLVVRLAGQEAVDVVGLADAFWRRGA